MENNMSRKDSIPKKMHKKQFRLPIQQSIKIIEEVKKIQKHSKIIKPDQNRKQYQELLQWALTKLEASKHLIYSYKPQLCGSQNQKFEEQTLDQQVQMQQRQTIQCLMQEMIQMFKKQCKQKAQLMQLCSSYFNQLINSYIKHCQKQLFDTFKTYNIALTSIQDQYQDEIVGFRKKISDLQSQKQTKWKNIYMLAKDNRVLRRQKGKLLRTIQEQDQKIKILQQELCQIVKQNEMNKLVIGYQNDNKNFDIYLKNRLAVLNFQKILEQYPKRAKKVLNNQLIKLQIEQLNSLDSKIDYIKKVILQSGDIFDEYEDLNQLVNKPNKILFNMFSQTDPENIQPPKQIKNFSVNTERSFFHCNFHIFSQVLDLKVSSYAQQKQQSSLNKYLNKNSNLLLFHPIKKQKHQDKPSLCLQLCSQVFNQAFKFKDKRRSNFSVSTYRPSVQLSSKMKIDQNQQLLEDSNLVEEYKKLKDKKQSDRSNLNSNRTSLNGIKKLASNKFPLNRKSEVINRTGYALNSPHSSKNTFMKTQQKSKDLSTFFSIQTYAQQSQNNQIISQKSQDQQNLVLSNNKLQSIGSKSEFQNTDKLNKFKNNKRISRRYTEIPSVTLQGGLTNHLLDEKNQKIQFNYNQQFFLNTAENKQSQVKTQKSNDSFQKGKKLSTKITAIEMSKVKKTQNIRKSMNLDRQMTEMGFIEEQQIQFDDQRQMVGQKNREKSRFSQNYTLNIPRRLGSQRLSKNQNHFNQSFSKTLRNSSFNPLIRLRTDHSNKGDASSMKSFVSNQNECSMLYQNLLTEPKPIQSLQGLQSQTLDPLMIKPYQVKKLVEKIIRSINMKRKELLSNNCPYSLKNYIQYFLRQLYGDKWKGDKNLLRYVFTIDDRQFSSSIRVFTILMNTKVHNEYLEDLFRLYVTMMDKNDFSGWQNYLSSTKSKSLSILKYLLSIYFDESTANQIQKNVPIFNHFQIDLNQVFILVEAQLRRYSIETQIYQFLCNLLPQNQSNIEFNQLKQVLFVFKVQNNYHTHLARLKYFFKTHGKSISNQQSLKNKTENFKTIKKQKSQKPSTLRKSLSKQLSKEEQKPQIQILPLHKVCFYLKRYEWTDILEIFTFIQEKYRSFVGVFIQAEAIKFISKYCLVLDENMKKKNLILSNGIMTMTTVKQKLQQENKPYQLNWLLSRSKEMIRNHFRYKSSIDKHVLMFIHLSILTYELQIGMQNVLSDSLNLLAYQYKRLKTTQELENFMKE